MGMDVADDRGRAAAPLRGTIRGRAPGLELSPSSRQDIALFEVFLRRRFRNAVAHRRGLTRRTDARLQRPVANPSRNDA